MWYNFPRQADLRKIFRLMDSQHSDTPQSLVNALRRLTRPLVKVMIANNITYPFLSRLLKRVFVEVANDHFQHRQKPLTDSRISMLTGVHRKDVKRFREFPETLQEPPQQLSIASKIIGQWQGNPLYTNKRGSPRLLNRSEFDALVTSVSTDIRPRTILDEWTQLEVVMVDEEQIKLNTDALIPSESFEGMAHYFGRNLEDHIAAAGENLMGANPPHLERAVYYPKLSQHSIERLQSIAHQDAMNLLQQINQEALKLQAQDRTDGGGDNRFRFGVYFYQEQQKNPDEESNP